ncbi:MAG TPA: CHASE domain-containing protein [Planctomycetota bacterium]|nr:CHASE domain-containing protein [Planctomycetota bacterium]
MLRKVGLPAFRIAVVALAYFLAGRLLSVVEVPEGYATAVWPPAGIALAAAILWGPSVLPGVWLGSFGIHLTREAGTLPALWLAIGSTLQAAAGLALTRRMVKRANPMDFGQPGPRALLVAGPLSCFVSPTWGVFTLVVLGRIAQADAPFNWAAWWVGDTIGVILFVPAVLAWTAQPAEIWRRRRWTLTAPLLACFIGVVAIYAFAQTWDRREAENQSREHHKVIAEAIHREIRQAAENVIGLGSFFDASNVVERDEFAVFAAPKLERASGLSALTWNPVVRRSERAPMETAMRAHGFPDFTFQEYGLAGELRPAAERDRYFPILFIEPQKTYESLLGFDIASEPVRAAAIERAIEDGRPTVSRRIHLLQEIGPGWGALLMAPVYRKETPHRSTEERRAAIDGVVVGVLQVQKLVEQAVAGRETQGLVIRVRDSDAGAGESLLYGKEAATGEGKPDVLEWSAGGRRWQIEIANAGPPPRAESAWIVLLAGVGLAGLFVAFVLEVATRQTEVERIVALRTRELGRANDELQKSNIELQRFAHVASHDLREPLRALGAYAQLLNESADALTPDHRKFLERIVHAAHRMQTLVDDLLALSRVEGSVATMSAVPVGQLVDMALENLEPRIEAAGAVVEIGELPEVTCDASPIVQLFQNLIGNAVKFRRPGVAPRVHIEGRRVGRFWEFAVRDNGIGIAPEHHERVFEMFERLHPRERYGGTGIGLAICRKIVERHGGRIWVESPPEGGSVFRFTLRAEGGTE